MSFGPRGPTRPVIAGVDTGGTFTDLIDAEGRTTKVLSDPAHPAQAVARGLTVLLGPQRPLLLAHGTTLATNALLEGRGARTALITTAGFADVIEIGRQDRPSLYDPFADRPPPLVPRELRFEVRERVGPRGEVLEPLDLASLAELPDDVEAVAVCLLHADLNEEHERTLEEVLIARGFDVTRSSAVSPEYREYERTVTTVINATLRPRCRAYLREIAELAEEVLVMTSAGGLLPATEAADHPVRLLLSGPAAGAQAAAALVRTLGFEHAVSLDMGGTSTDVCLVRDGAPEVSPSLVVGGYPVRVPALDVHTIGAGGGSIAFLDPGGALRVGPESAGADPGPACYGRGGDRPTVTDADLLLGRIPAEAPFPDLGQLDREAARGAFARAGIDPAGVVEVVDTNMVQAVRRVSAERGVDPRQLALVAFGGAGPLHACAVAAALEMPAVVVPPRAGVFSAVGLLTSPRQREVVRSWPTPSDHAGLEQCLANLAHEARRLVGSGAEVQTFVDCRYRGQSHELTVRAVEEFHAEHERRNGFARPGWPVEVVALRARARRPAPLDPGALPPVERAGRVVGPAVLAEPDCTVYVADGWEAHRHETGAWIVHRRGE